MEINVTVQMQQTYKKRKWIKIYQLELKRINACKMVRKMFDAEWISQDSSEKQNRVHNRTTKRFITGINSLNFGG